MPCLMEQPQRKSSAECDKAELAEDHRQRVAVDGENNGVKGPNTPSKIPSLEDSRRTSPVTCV